MDPHQTVGPLGIVLPDPDQGIPYIQVQFTMPSTMLMVFEPWSEEEIAERPELANTGHNLHGFARRWAAWAAGRDPYFESVEPRFGWPQLIPRSAIAHVAGFRIDYHRREDVRAGHRGRLAVAGQPSVRQLGDGAIEVTIPR